MMFLDFSGGFKDSDHVSHGCVWCSFSGFYFNFYYITRRWKVLCPQEVRLLQEARKTRKAALISNFVDRESERPALGVNDFIPLPITGPVSDPEKMDQSRKHKRKSRY